MIRAGRLKVCATCDNPACPDGETLCQGFGYNYWIPRKDCPECDSPLDEKGRCTAQCNKRGDDYES